MDNVFVLEMSYSYVLVNCAVRLDPNLARCFGVSDFGALAARKY